MVKHKLAIDYNVNRPIGVISADPYNFLVFDKLFDNFQIITPRQQNWLKDLPLKADVTSLNLKRVSVGENISRYVSSKKFVELSRLTRSANSPFIRRLTHRTRSTRWHF